MMGCVLDANPIYRGYQARKTDWMHSTEMRIPESMTRHGFRKSGHVTAKACQPNMTENTFHKKKSHWRLYLTESMVVQNPRLVWFAKLFSAQCFDELPMFKDWLPGKHSMHIVSFDKGKHHENALLSILLKFSTKHTRHSKSLSCGRQSWNSSMPWYLSSTPVSWLARSGNAAPLKILWLPPKDPPERLLRFNF